MRIVTSKYVPPGKAFLIHQDALHHEPSAPSAFVRALEAEVQGAMRDIARDMNRMIWGPPWLSSDRSWYKWPEFEVVPGWFRARRRWHALGRPYRWARRWRRELEDRCDLAWRALKGEELWDW